MSLSDEPLVLTPRLARRHKLTRWITRKGSTDLGRRIVFDMRAKWPENWAHFLMNHLPLLSIAASTFGLAAREITVIVPEGMPRNIVRFLGLLDLPVAETDGPVRGRPLVVDPQPINCRESAQKQWVDLPFLDEPITRIARSGDRGLPRRAFLSRRGTRTLANEAEVIDFLGEGGFVPLYVEDLAAEDQVALFHEAETIVAIHGAALGPLLYRSAASRLGAVVELMPCGHMSPMYRVVAWQVGCRWSGVRGRLKPELLSAPLRPEQAVPVAFARQLRDRRREPRACTYRHRRRSVRREVASC